MKNIKKTTLSTLVIIITMCLNAYGQMTLPPGVTVKELEEAKKRLEMERDAIFTDALHLTISQAADFSPIYSRYSREKNELDEDLIRLMVDYLKEYEHADRKFMHEFIVRSERYQKEDLKLRKRYFKEINKKISMQVASEFYELDDFCATVLRLNILVSLPFTQRILK
jgi:hypothetical protein